jgi:hypothetical protein
MDESHIVLSADKDKDPPSQDIERARFMVSILSLFFFPPARWGFVIRWERACDVSRSVSIRNALPDIFTVAVSYGD